MSLGPDRLAQLDAALAFLAGRLEHDRPIGPLSTYRVGGPARRYVEVAAPDELARIALALADGIPRPSDDVLVVGKGSNLPVADGGEDALVLQLGEPSGRLTLYFDHLTELANWGRWITAEAERLKHENTRQAGGFDVVA